MPNDLDLQLILSATDELSGIVKSAMKKSGSALDSFEGKLTKTSSKMKELGKSATITGAAITAAGAGIAHAFKMDSAISDMFELEHQLRQIKITGGLTEAQLAGIDTKLTAMTKTTNKFKGELVEGMNVMVAAGFEVENALGFMPRVGKVSTATGAAVSDVAGLAYDMANNLKIAASQIDKAFEVMNTGAKAGRFEFRDMASEFSALTASAKFLGIQGVEGVAELTSALEVARRGAGSGSEAANNMANYLRALSSPLVVKNMQEEWGVNLPNLLKKAKTQGYDPILAVMEQIQKSSGGDINKISKVFRDAQVQNFIKPMLADLKDYQAIKAEALGATGTIDADYIDMLTTSKEQWKALQIIMQSNVFESFEDDIKKVNKVLIAVTSNPILAKGIFGAIMGTIGVGVLTTGVGAASSSIGTLVGIYGKAVKYAPQIAAMMRMDWVRSIPINKLNLFTGAVRSVQLAFGAGSAAAFLPMAGIIAGVAAAGFVIWKYWKPISGFFKDGFDGLKAGLEPIKPALDSIGEALSPLKEAFGGFFSQVEGDAKGSESAIYKVMDVTGKLITKVAQGWSYIANLKGLFNGDKYIDDKGNVQSCATPVDGSHANGLDYVPYDGYIAKTHEGEGILTKEENKNYRLNPPSRSGASISVVYSPTIHADAMSDIKGIEAMLERSEQRLLAKLKTEQRRAEARAYAPA